MYVVQPKKKESMTLVIATPVNRVGRNWNWQNYKSAGAHKDKRRKSRNNERVSFRLDEDHAWTT